MIINTNINACTEMSLHYLVMGLRAGYPKLSLWHVDDFKLKTIKAQQTQEEIFIPPLTALKNLDRRLVPERELLAEITFFPQEDLSAWPSTHFCTKHLLFPSFCELLSPPFKCQAPTHFSLAQDGI